MYTTEKWGSIQLVQIYNTFRTFTLKEYMRHVSHYCFDCWKMSLMNCVLSTRHIFLAALCWHIRCWYQWNCPVCKVQCKVFCHYLHIEVCTCTEKEKPSNAASCFYPTKKFRCFFWRQLVLIKIFLTFSIKKNLNFSGKYLEKLGKICENFFQK